MSGYSIRPITLKDVDEVWNIEKCASRFPGPGSPLCLRLSTINVHAILSLNMPGLLWATAECGWCLMKPISQILQCTRLPEEKGSAKPAEGING